jgi:hypothetical protein
MLIVLRYSNDDLVDKEEILVKFGQLHLFGPVLLGHEDKEMLVKFSQLRLFGPVLLGHEDEEILVKFSQLHSFRPVLLGLENMSENLHTVIFIKPNYLQKLLSQKWF